MRLDHLLSKEIERCGASLISEVDTGGNRGERELDLLPDRVYDLWFLVVVTVYF